MIDLLLNIHYEIKHLKAKKCFFYISSDDVNDKDLASYFPNEHWDKVVDMAMSNYSELSNHFLDWARRIDKATSKNQAGLIT